MPDLNSPSPLAALRQLDIEIEESERFLRIWQTQAEIHEDTAFHDASRMIVAEYVARLDALRGARDAARVHLRS